jgi:hypothetical protein
LRVEEGLGYETYAAKNDGYERLNRQPVGQDELKNHLRENSFELLPPSGADPRTVASDVLLCLMLDMA